MRIYLKVLSIKKLKVEQTPNLFDIFA